MSLFGASPEASPLFDDESMGKRSRVSAASGLLSHEDETRASNDSPWDFISRSRKGANTVRSLLASAKIPNSYIEAFDGLLSNLEHSENTLPVSEVSKFLVATGLSTQENDKILKLVRPPSSDGLEIPESIDRNEFNVIIALAGLSQEGEDVSLDGVDERKLHLPETRLPSPKSITKLSPMSSSSAHRMYENLQGVRHATEGNRTRSHKQAFNALEQDPWGSPTQQRTNGSHPPASERKMGGFSTSVAGNSPANLDDEARQANTEWTGYSGNFSNRDTDNVDFDFSAQPGDRINRNLNTAPSSGPPGHYAQRSEEYVTVNSLPDKEGVFLFQYRNYEVGSSRRNSKVIRRYSDFVWLLDCIQKKYPFRQLPLLPPKRVAINGNHIAADSLFIEKRRRGLVRFVNALVRHPILSQEQLVIMFLTVPTELSVWRKQAAITISEEFSGKTLSPALEESLPVNLEELFGTVRSGVQRSASTYMTLCTLMERLVKRKQGFASEFSRFSTILASLNDTSMDTYRMDTNDVPLLNDGVKSASRHIETGSQLLMEEANSWDEVVLEDFKRMRDQLVSMRDMFDRREKYAKDNIPVLEKRIFANETKLAGVRAKAEGQRKLGEAERLEEAIMKDKESIVQQHARQILIRECIRDEINHFQATLYQISRMHQDWTQEGVKYAELTAEYWRSWAEDVDGMPSGAHLT